jgi:hypothetical protein
MKAQMLSDAMSNDWKSTWRKDMEAYTSDEGEIKLLREGPKSFMQAMHLGALKKRFMKIMHYE